MDLKTAGQIAASAMSAQRLRLNLISSNLANANTTRTSEGGPYRRKDAIFIPQSIEDDGQDNAFMDYFKNEVAKGVKVARIEETADYKMVYDPYHPDANPEGYVVMPNINVVEEMVDLLSCSRSYEANVQAMRTLKSMAEEALKIG